MWLSDKKYGVGIAPSFLKKGEHMRKTTLFIFAMIWVHTTFAADNSSKVVCEAICGTGGAFHDPVRRLVYAGGDDAVAVFTNLETQCGQLAKTYNTRTKLFKPSQSVPHETTIHDSCFLVNDLPKAD